MIIGLGPLLWYFYIIILYLHIAYTLKTKKDRPFAELRKYYNILGNNCINPKISAFTWFWCYNLEVKSTETRVYYSSLNNNFSTVKQFCQLSQHYNNTDGWKVRYANISVSNFDIQPWTEQSIKANASFNLELFASDDYLNVRRVELTCFNKFLLQIWIVFQLICLCKLESVSRSLFTRCITLPGFPFINCRL